MLGMSPRAKLGPTSTEKTGVSLTYIHCTPTGNMADEVLRLYSLFSSTMSTVSKLELCGVSLQC